MFVSKYANNPMLLARRDNAMAKQVMRSGKLTTVGDIIRAYVAKGAKVEKKVMVDTTATVKANKEYAFLVRHAPIGNENHPDTKRLREIQAMTRDPYDHSRVLVHSVYAALTLNGDTVRQLTPMEEDYALELLG